MKKVVLGSVMVLAGVISTAIILYGTMIATRFINNGVYTISWQLSQYQLTAPLVIFVVIAVIGIALSIWGLFEKENR
jgi:TRAP-type C4-dicarboxylate transport system permease small subunit